MPMTITHDFRRGHEGRIAAVAQAGELVYVGLRVAPPMNTRATDGATDGAQRPVIDNNERRRRRQLLAEVSALGEMLRPRGLELVDRGAFYFEVRALTPALRTTEPCRACGGQVWCGSCRRCGTKP